MKINIKALMDQKGITRYELAQKIGVTYPTINLIYNGQSTSIKFDILESLCRELDCTPNDILISDDTRLKRLLAYNHEFEKIKDKGDAN